MRSLPKKAIIFKKVNGGEHMGQKKSGVIDVGGGMRGIYATGVFDRCLDDGVAFDVAIGISAGSANIASYISGQRGRNISFYADYSFRPQYMSARNFLLKGSYIDMDYVYSTLSNDGGENPLDYDAFASSPIDWRIVACNAKTGETKYFDKHDMARNRYDVLKASSSIPLVCKPYFIDGVPYFDGALGDTIPVEKAFEMGCEKVVLILTKPAAQPRPVGSDKKIASVLRWRYPKAAERLCGRADRYNFGVGLAQALERDGLALVISPDDTCGVDTLARDKDALARLYAKGYEDGAQVKPFLEQEA